MKYRIETSNLSIMQKKYLSVILASVLALLSVFAGHAQTGTQKINKKNLVVKEWNTNGNGASKTLDHITTFTSERRKIEEIEYDSIGKQKWRKRWEWGENGKQARELVYDERNRLVSYKTFEYNEFGRKKTQYTYNAKGKLIGTKLYEYVTQDD